MTYPLVDSTDIVQVVQALSNGLRSEVEIAKTSRLSLDRIRVALDTLVVSKCVIGSPQAAEARFRLSDKGNDMVKAANAAERRARM